MTIDEILTFDESRLSDKETLYAIYEEQEPFERQRLLNTLKDRASELKCARKVAALIKAFEAELKAQLRSDNGNRKTDFGYPYADEYYCGAWIADNNGVRIATLIGEQVACYHPILPVERLHNLETQTEKIKLAYKRNGVWHEITVGKDVSASASKIVALAQYGVAVTSENAKWLVKFLADLENFNEIPVKNSTSKLGWSGEQFLPFDHAVAFDSSTKFGEIVKAVAPMGSWDIWMQTVSAIRRKGRFEPRLVMAASFASVLLKPLNLLPFVLNLSSGTGAGKTVALMLATSIWANPGEHRYLVEVEATQVGFEVRLDVLNNLPLMIDDFSKIEDKFKDRFTDLIYMLTSGRGKDRANVDLGLNASKTWCNATIGAMEKPLTNDSMRGGAINRVLDFAASDGKIFGEGKEANALVETLKENYGMAGREFVRIVQEIGFAELAAMRREIEDEIRGIAAEQSSEKEDKQILPLSAILLADRLTADRLFHDDVYLDAREMVRQLADIDATSDYRRAYEFIMSWVNVHIKEFDGGNDPDRHGGLVSGFFRDGYVCIFKSAMGKIANEGGFNVKAFYRDAKTKGTVDWDRKHNRNPKVEKLGSSSARVYKIKMEVFEGDEAESDFMDIPDEIQETLPFND